MQELVRMCIIQSAPSFSGGGYVPSFVSGPINPVFNERVSIKRRPEFAFVARCKRCHREFHLDPNTPVPPAFCGLGITHGCGASDWHVFKRSIEVEVDPEYVDDCIYSDTHTFPPDVTEERIDSLQEMWKHQLSRVHTADYSQVKYEPDILTSY